MQDAAKEYIKETVWAFNPEFLSDYVIISQNTPIKDTTIKVIKLLQNDCEDELIEDFDEFADDAINSDGRGHFLNHYDGSEIKYSLNGVTYYAYQS